MGTSAPASSGKERETETKIIITKVLSAHYYYFNNLIVTILSLLVFGIL